MMRTKTFALCVMWWATCGVLAASAQQVSPSQTPAAERNAVGQRAALTEQAVAFDAQGRVVLQGRLLTTELRATLDAPLSNARLTIENPTASAYSYLSGWATFYDTQGVRCGEGLWALNALAPSETAEVDVPGLRLTCTPAAWRIAVLNLVGGVTIAAALPANATDNSLPPVRSDSSSLPMTTTGDLPVAPTRLELNINGERFSVQLGQTLELEIGKERVRITVNAAP